MGVRGGQEGALVPPWLGKIVCFSIFLKESGMLLRSIFKANRKFCPPLEIKSADAHARTVEVLSKLVKICRQINCD